MGKSIFLGVVILTLSNSFFLSEASAQKVITINKKDYPVEALCTSENRNPDSAGNAYVKITVKGLESGWVFTKVELSKAEDDTGKNLIRNKVKTLNEDASLFEEKDPDFSLWLKQSDRTAKVIKEIEGTLYLQNSGSGKKVNIPNFKDKDGEFIVNDELKKHGIKIAYINSKTFDDDGGDIVLEAITPNSDNFNKDQRKAALASMKMACSQPGIVNLVVQDPNQKILKMEAVDPKTKKTVKSMTTVNNFFIIPTNGIFTRPGKEKPNYTDLHVYLKDKQSVQKAPFKLQNIKLP